MALLISVQNAAAAEYASQVFMSRDQRVTLIELFTSEGCSSCPPADRWLSDLKTNPDLWKEFTPVAFHVDYWDYIGWKDRFARADYSDRQRRYAAEGGTRVVYTPGVFRNGQEWRGWRGKPARISQPSSSVGILTLCVVGQHVAARFNPTSMHDAGLTLNIVLLGMHLQTQVRAGENKGKTLRHDFVALDKTSVPMERSGGAYRAMSRLPGFEIQAERHALAAWVSEDASQTPIQSVGGFLLSAGPNITPAERPKCEISSSGPI